MFSDQFHFRTTEIKFEKQNYEDMKNKPFWVFKLKNELTDLLSSATHRKLPFIFNFLTYAKKNF